MTRIQLFLLALCVCCCSFGLQAQFTFPTQAGPFNVTNVYSPATNVILNTTANSAGVPAGQYRTFSLTLNWVAGTGGPWSSEARLRVTTASGQSVELSPSSGQASNGNPAMLTFTGTFAGLYNPTTDGMLTLGIRQSFSTSTATWSNLSFTINPFVQPPPPTTVGSLATSGCNDMVTLSTSLTANGVRWVEFNYDGNSQSLTFDTEGSTLTAGTFGPDDTEIGLYDSNGFLIAIDDDGGTGGLSSLTRTGLTAGTYYIAAGGFNVNFDPANFNVTSVFAGSGTLVFNVTASGSPTLVCNAATVSLDAAGTAILDLAAVTTASTICDGDALSADVTAFDCTDTGVNVVTVSLTPAGGTAPQTCLANVTVLDNILPTLDCSNLVGVQAFTADAITCLYTVMGTELDPTGFSDNCGIGALKLLNNFNATATLAGAEFPVGTTMVTFTLFLGLVDVASCTVTVEVASGSPACDPPPSGCGEFGYTIQFSSEELFQVDLATGALTSIATLSPSPGNNGTPLITGGTIIENELYFTDAGEQDFVYSVNIGTGVVTEQAPIAGVVAGEGVRDFEVDPTTGTLYGLSINCGSNSTLYEVDLDSATPFTAIGSITGATCAPSLVINMLGEAFVLDIIADAIIPVNLATGAGGTPVPIVESDGVTPINLNQTQGTDFSCMPGSTTMMGFIYDQNASAPRFGTLDPATGIFTDTPGAGPYTGNAYALFAIGTGDTEPPVIVCRDTTVALDADGMAMLENGDVVTSIIDNCDPNPSGPNTMGGPGARTFDCTQAGTDVSVTVVSSDANGNQGSCTYTVSVVDTLAPVLVCRDTTIALNAAGTAMLDNAQTVTSVVDNCDPNPTGPFPRRGPDARTFDCTQAGTDVAVIFVSSDVNGNEGSCTIAVSVIDTLAPVITCTTDSTVQ
ncbi:MAG: hypothetical protein WBA17_14695, partial [Saprospiraceae bacterium]